jgi:acetate---CoA ligase (ADP-forming)
LEITATETINNTNIKYLMSPNSIAIIGCSETNMGGQVLTNLLQMGYKGEIYPVHPTQSTVYGKECFSSINALPEDIDCAVIAIRSSLVKKTLQELELKKVKSAVIFASGFAETGEEGKREQQSINELLSRNGMAVCGPNCLGLINVNKQIPLYSTVINRNLKPGGIGVVSHSGSAAIALVGAGRKQGFSYVISAGNEAGITTVDYFRYLVEDQETKVIVGVLETIKDPVGLSKVAKLAREKGKPIIILKVGKTETGGKVSASHTGGIVGSAHLHKSFFRQSGIIEVDSYNEIIETAEILLKYGLNVPQGDGVGMIAISGGQLALTCDIADSMDLRIPEIEGETKNVLARVLPEYACAANPLDGTTDALLNTRIYKECVQAIANDPNIDLLVICQDATSGLDASLNIYQNVAEAIAEVSKTINKPIIVFTHVSGGLDPKIQYTLNAAGIPLLQGAHASMRAIKNFIEYAKQNNQFAQNYTGAHIFKNGLSIDNSNNISLSENEGKRLLYKFGIPVTREKVITEVSDGIHFANNIGYPVAVKVDSPDILHKTEAKVINLNVASDQELRESITEVLENARNYNLNARINGVNIQEMVPKGIETIIGIKRDPVYGLYIILGIGGIFVELIKDISIRILPITESDAYEMINELKGRDALYGFRGMNKADIKELTRTLVNLSKMVMESPVEITELEINPLIVLEEGQGVKAVDTLVTINNNIN